jgi:hypothetical protein
LILSVVPAAKNLKPWSWEAVSLSVLNARAGTLKSRCRFLRIAAAVEVPHPVIQVVAQDVQAVQAQTAVHAIETRQPADIVRKE